MALRQYSCVATGLCLSVVAVPATAVEGFEAQPAQIAPLADSTLLLDAVHVDGVYVAVGDRGHILTSSDAGETWQQQAVPTRSMLTAVWFHDRQTGWAVGHDALVLKTTDGGETWTPKHYAPDPEQPLFDVWFAEDGQRGLAVGAYGFLLSTADGGETWEASSLEADTWDPQAAEAEAGGEDDPATEALDEDEGYDEWDDVEGGVHLNKISRAADGTLWIGAEAGNLYRSDDGGDTWLKIPTPYDGSFFGILPVGSSGVLAFGLRGNLFFTDDRGANWTRLETPETVSLNDALELEDGRIVIVGMAGTLLVGSPETGFELRQQEDRKAIVQVLPADGSLLLFGEAGAVKIPVPAG
jgi:photosystem II stability/assembly factor-like uncharacterized protein